MKARYLGNPTPDSDGPMRVAYCGKSFARGVFVSLDGIPGGQVEKLRNNPTFEVSDEPMTDDDLAADAGANEPEVEAPTPDGDEPAADKATLLAQLEALKARHPDVEFSAKMGVPKLKAILEEARFIHDDDEG